MRNNTTLCIKLIGIAATIFFVQTTAIAKNLVGIDSIDRVAPPASKFDKQFKLIAQNNLSKVDEYSRLGKQKYEKGDYKGALADLNRVIQLDPNNVKACNSRGTVKVKLKDYQGALVDLNRSIQLDPNFAKPYVNRGALKALQFQDNKGALADLNRAIQLDSRNADAYNNRSLLKYHNLKDRSGAIADLQKVSELLQQQGNLKEAQRVRGIVKQWQLEAKKSGSA